MDRRAFLGAFAAMLVLDPERLLWHPGAKLISIPKPQTSGLLDGLVAFWEIDAGDVWSDGEYLLPVHRRVKCTPEEIAALFDAGFGVSYSEIISFGGAC